MLLMELTCDIPDSGISDELIQLFLQLSHFVSPFFFFFFVVFSIFNVPDSYIFAFDQYWNKNLYLSFLMQPNNLSCMNISAVWSLCGCKSWWIKIYHPLLPWCFSWSSLGGKTWKEKQNKGVVEEKFSNQNWSWGVETVPE